jgi:hypothetical protein
MLVKIKDKVFTYKTESVQYAFDDFKQSVTIFYAFDIVKYPECKKFFIDMWDNQFQSVMPTSYKVDFITSNYQAFGCFMKLMDVSDSEVGVSFLCDYVKEFTLQERREGILNKLLD